MLNYNAINRFIDDLRVNGFSIGVVEEQRVIYLLVSLQNAGAVPSSVGELGSLIAPVLCCTAEQQGRFQTRFDAHFGSTILSEPPPGPPPAPSPPVPGQRTRRPGFFDVWRTIPRRLRRQITVRLMITCLAAMFVMFALPRILDATGIIHLPPPPPFDRPDVPAPQPDPQQLDWLANQIRDLARQTSGAVTRSLAGPRTLWQRMQIGLGPFTFFTFSAPFILLGAWIVAPGRQRGGYVSRRQVSARPRFIDLLLGAKNEDLFGDFASPRRLQPLRRPRLAASNEIDVEACIPRMLENGGFFDPVFRQRMLAPDHLVLIDRRSSGDHIARCGQALVEAMQAANVYVDAYWFDRDPRRLFRSLDGPSVSLEEVAGRHGEHRLIFIASGEGLFDWASGAVEPWALIFRQFARRVMLTPVARELWGYREQAIFSTLDMAIFPLAAAAIERMVETLAAEELPRPVPPAPAPPSEAQDEILLADLLEERPFRWIMSSPPTQVEQDELLLGLKRALSKVEWRWLSACAVYPQLVWKLTLFLGANLRWHEGNRRPFIDQLVAVARLPWFRVGSIPFWIRERLTGLMDEDEYRRAERMLSELLMTTLQPVRSGALLAIGRDRGDRRSVPTEIRDEVLVDFLSRPPSERTSTRLPDKVASRFGRAGTAGGWFRRIFAGQRSEEIRSDAELVRTVLSETDATLIEVRLPGVDDGLGPDYRVVERLLNKAGEARAGDGFILYLPAGSGNAYILNDWTVDFHRRSRRLAFILGTCNLVLVVLSLIIFYGDPDRHGSNVALHLMLAMGWITLPFITLFGYLVFPITRLLTAFPLAQSLDPGPRHVSRRYKLVLR